MAKSLYPRTRGAARSIPHQSPPEPKYTACPMAYGERGPTFDNGVGARPYTVDGGSVRRKAPSLEELDGEGELPPTLWTGDLGEE